MNILILTGGPKIKLEEFAKRGIDTASFMDISFQSGKKILEVDVNGIRNDLNKYDLIYFRMVGKSLEVATLVASYAKENGIKIVDGIYTDSNLMPITLAKSVEMFKLSKAGIPIPKTAFGDFSSLKFPFVVKSTTGQKSREVWLAKDIQELEKIKQEKYEKGKFYFAQEFIPNSIRIRALVIGDKVVGALVRETKWNRGHERQTLNPIPVEISDLALKASRASGIEICGVDILKSEISGQMWVIETNAAPAWKLINKNCKVVVEDEIIKYLQTKV